MRLRRTCSDSTLSSATARSRTTPGRARSHAGPTEVRVALSLEPWIRVAHEVGPRAAEHHLEVGGLGPHVLEAVDDVGGPLPAIPPPRHGVLSAASADLG